MNDVADVHAGVLMLHNGCVYASDRSDVEAGNPETGINVDRVVRDAELSASGCKDRDTRSSDELLVDVVGVFVRRQDGVGTVETACFAPDSGIDDERLTIRLEAHARM